MQRLRYFAQPNQKLSPGSQPLLHAQCEAFDGHPPLDAQTDITPFDPAIQALKLGFPPALGLEKRTITVGRLVAAVLGVARREAQGRLDEIVKGSVQGVGHDTIGHGWRIRGAIQGPMEASSVVAIEKLVIAILKQGRIRCGFFLDFGGRTGNPFVLDSQSGTISRAVVLRAFQVVMLALLWAWIVYDLLATGRSLGSFAVSAGTLENAVSFHHSLVALGSVRHGKVSLLFCEAFDTLR